MEIMIDATPGSLANCVECKKPFIIGSRGLYCSETCAATDMELDNTGFLTGDWEEELGLDLSDPQLPRKILDDIQSHINRIL